jgi:hypothetical protein
LGLGGLDAESVVGEYGLVFGDVLVDSLLIDMCADFSESGLVLAWIIFPELY